MIPYSDHHRLHHECIIDKQPIEVEEDRERDPRVRTDSILSRYGSAAVHPMADRYRGF